MLELEILTVNTALTLPSKTEETKRENVQWEIKPTPLNLQEWRGGWKGYLLAFAGPWPCKETGLSAARHFDFLREAGGLDFDV